jgi:hypothetical protein
MASGAALGAAWGLILPAGFGFFSLFLGLGIGYVIAEAVGLATNRKSGPVIATLGVAGVVIAYLVRNIIADSAIVITNDFSGVLVLIAGVIMVINRLRY